jgi:geranylgeranyl diphosphate synthase, type II
VDLSQYKNEFLDYLSKRFHIKQPNNLYEPIDYILNLGGKRIRPILVLLSCDLFGGNTDKALDAALAVEMFHNFTLIHDDIMDNASLRRGKETVHEKWDNNIAILSGDALMILSYQILEQYEGDAFKQLYTLFNKTALQICEGQQYDMDFEKRNDVTLDDYLKMIRYKTAVLLACSLQMGAIISKAGTEDVLHIYNYGLHLGTAFQLQDDYLDTYGADKFGKKVGGDILENKKTFLYIKSIELASKNDKEELLKWFAINEHSENKINRVIEIYNRYKIKELLHEEIKKYSALAFESVFQLTLSESSKNKLIELGEYLMKRKE